MKGVTQVAESGKHKMPFRITKEMKRMDPNLTQDEGEVIWPTRGKQCRPYEFDAMAFLTSAEYEKLKEKKKDTVGDEKPKPSIDSNPELFDKNGIQSVF